jgi:hypothetical protein
MLLSCRNESGGLHRLLTPLAEQGISMTRIESRPSRQGVWDYVFFVDICGHRAEPLVASALEDLKEAANLCKVLGSYPEAVLVNEWRVARPSSFDPSWANRIWAGDNRPSRRWRLRIPFCNMPRRRSRG